MPHIPYMRFKRWLGRSRAGSSVPERFRNDDINRLTANNNAIAAFKGLSTVPYITAGHNEQFRYDEQNKIESHHIALANALGATLPITPVTIWGAYRAVTFVDFDRSELNPFSIYRSLSGAGLRQDSDRVETLRIYGEDWIQQSDSSWQITVYSRITHSGDHGFISRSTWQSNADKSLLTYISPSVIDVQNNAVTLRQNGVHRPNDIDIELHIWSIDMLSTQTFILQPNAWIVQPDGTFKQSITYPGVTPTTEGLTGFDTTATAEQREEAQQAQLRCSGHSADSIEFSIRDEPTLPYPIRVQIFVWEA